jgi:hypothetical protein
MCTSWWRHPETYHMCNILWLCPYKYISYVYGILQSTDRELIPARNASLAAVQGSTSGSSARYYPTWKHSLLKERNEQGCYSVIQTARCLQLGYESTKWKSSVHLHAFNSPRTALMTFTPRRDQLVICGQCVCVCVCVCVCARARALMYVCIMHVCVCVCMCICIFFPLCSCSHITITTIRI